MRACERVMLIDFENMIGGAEPRESLIRSRITALLTAAGPAHHRIACYAPKVPREDPVASVLAELGVAPWPVPRGADAADRALLRHAQYVHDRGCRLFTVASGDGRFAQLAALGRLEVLGWTDQSVSRALIGAAGVNLRRLDRPPATAAGQATAPLPRSAAAGASTRPVTCPAHGPAAPPGSAPDPDAPGPGWRRSTATAVLTGIGLGIGQRLAHAALRR